MARAGQIFLSQATFTPGAAAHGAGDVIGAATAFPGVSAYSNSGTQIISASLLVASGVALTTVWRVHFYDATPPSAIADNGVFDIAAGDRANYLGFIDIAQLQAFTSSLYVQSDNLNKAIRPSGSRGLFGYLVATSGITTAAVAHTVTLFTLE